MILHYAQNDQTVNRMDRKFFNRKDGQTMKNRTFMKYLTVCLTLGLLLGGCKSTGCAAAEADSEIVSEADSEIVSEANSEAVSEDDSEKDFAAMQTPDEQEQAYEYRSFFLPEIDWFSQPYVGDPMPYYEDGVYYIYYLKEAGDSYRHSIYLTTTTDFVTYTEYEDPILESAEDPEAQDAWIGTGSVVKVGDTYYLFYTGHGDSASLEYKEKIMVAVGSSPDSFEKKAGWEITPPDELGQKNDFRDPQAYYDAETGKITLTVTAAQDGTARILKYTLDENLETSAYDGIIFTDPVGGFWNLECSDTFQIGDTWYLTYSAQDDTLWYAASETPYGPYGEPVRLDGKLFYAAKHVEDGENAYMVGWVRRSESPSSTQVSAWAGNLAVQKLVQKEDGTLCLAPVDAVAESFSVPCSLAQEDVQISAAEGEPAGSADAFTCYESFLLTGRFQYSGEGSFGLSFDYNGEEEESKRIAISPAEGKVQLLFHNGDLLIAETAADLTPGEEYSFTYIQEGSAGIFYIDGEAALTVRIYGASGKSIRLFAENNEVQFSSLQQYTRP